MLEGWDVANQETPSVHHEMQGQADGCKIIPAVEGRSLFTISGLVKKVLKLTMSPSYQLLVS